MTPAEKSLRDAYIEKAKSFEDKCAEGSSNHVAIVRAFNSAPGGGGMSTSSPWCATFVGAVGYLTGLAGTAVKISASCHDDKRSLYNQYTAINKFRLRSSYKYPDTPVVGDLALYGTRPWRESDICHVGIVVDSYWINKTKLYIETLDGNWEDNVTRHDENSSYQIVGICELDFSSFNFTEESAEVPVAKVYHNGAWNKSLQNVYTNGRWYRARSWTFTQGNWISTDGRSISAAKASELVDASETYSKDAPLSQDEMKVNARYLWQVFQKRGWTLNAVAGMLGNMEYESTINPGAWQDFDGDGPAFGLVQWDPASKYLNWCAERGLEPSHMDSAIARIQWEYDNGQQYYRTSSYPLTFKQFSQSTATPEYLAEVFINNYERPAERNQPKRWKAARKWYDYLSATIYQPTI